MNWSPCHRVRFAGSLVLGLTLATGVAAASAQCEFGRLDPRDPDSFQGFGTGLALQGNRLVVGAPGDDSAACGAGAAYVLELDGLNWFVEAELFASDASSGLDFGDSVALDGEILVVGDTRSAEGGNSAGAAYVFEKLGGVWIEQAKLVASDASASSFAGTSVGVRDRTVFMGAPLADSAGPNSGAVYVFEEVGGMWTEVDILTMGSISTLDVKFGEALVVEGTTLVITAIDSDNANGIDAGAAYVFTEQNGIWIQVQQLLASNGVASDNFGDDVDLDGDVLVIGARQTAVDGLVLAGAATVFRESGGLWTEEATLFASDPEFSQSFGRDVAVSGTTILIGAPATTGALFRAGATYVFEDRGGTWTEVNKLIPAEITLGADYGWTVVADGDLALVDAPQQTVGLTTFQGAVWSYSLSDTTCPTLSAQPASISLSSGGSQCFSLDPGLAFANEFYWLIGSLSGTDPGFQIAGARLPIVPDDYFFLTLIPGPQSPLLNSMERLDTNGQGQAKLRILPGTDPSLFGLFVHHAFVVVELGPLSISHVSNTVELILKP